MLRELEWEPQVRSAEIGVSVKDGIVTLSGAVDSYSKRYHAERAAKRVAGVKAVVNDLEVHLPSSSERTDEDIARAALRALEGRITVPRDRIKVTVSDGWITLEGEVEWQYQRRLPTWTAARPCRMARSASPHVPDAPSARGLYDQHGCRFRIPLISMAPTDGKVDLD